MRWGGGVEIVDMGSTSSGTVRTKRRTYKEYGEHACESLLLPSRPNVCSYRLIAYVAKGHKTIEKYSHVILYSYRFTLYLLQIKVKQVSFSLDKLSIETLRRYPHI